MAVAPFIVVFVVPLALVAVYFIHHHHASTHIDIPGNNVCVQAETPVANGVDKCTSAVDTVGR